MPSLSVVVPAYNEAERIGAPLADILAYLDAQPYSAEVVVVDDGSTDQTFAFVQAVARGTRIPVRAFRYQTNAGKGFAIKCGVAQARGQRILFTDADLSTPIEDTARLLAALEAGADVAIGSRKIQGARIVVPQPWWRMLLGKMFTWLVRCLIAGVSDATCGFKAFQGTAGREIFARVRVYDWSFDAEVLMLTRRLGYRLVEVPVRWEDRAGTKVRLLRDVPRSLRGLIRIRLNDARGVYRQPGGATAVVDRWESGVETAALRASE